MPDDSRGADVADVAVIRALGVLAVAPLRTRLALLFVLCGLGLWVDWITGPDASLVLAYTITVALAAWTFMSRWPAYITAIGLSLGSGAATVLAASNATATPIVWLNAAVRAASLIILATVVSALRGHLVRAERLALWDPLTGVASRHAILELLERTSRRPRASDLPLSVVYFDLVGLKQINDRAGHAAGDALLRRFATATLGGVRAVDRLGRLGGDEFLLICPGADADDVAAIMQRLTDNPNLPDVSWGVASTTEPADPAALVAAADAAMYTTKPKSPP